MKRRGGELVPRQRLDPKRLYTEKRTLVGKIMKHRPEKRSARGRPRKKWRTGKERGGGKKMEKDKKGGNKAPIEGRSKENLRQSWRKLMNSF